MTAPGKYTEFVDTPDSPHNLVVDQVPERATVLEFGCATGYMSEVLKSRRGATVTGVEISPEAAAIAESRCDRVIVGDAESLDFDDLLGAERFDAVLFADVLEHLRDPGAVLRRIRPFLSETGAVVASIPNVAHGSVRLALLGGEFRYRETGLLDDTHLRFFTRSTIQDLFEASGYVITTWLRKRIDIDETEIKTSLPASLHEWLATDPEATTYQFVVRALPADADGQLERTRLELRAAQADLDRTRRLAEHAERLEKQLVETVQLHGDHARQLEARIAALAEGEIEMRQLLRDANDQLLRRDEQIRELESQRTAVDDEQRAEELRHRDEEISWLRGNLEDAQGVIAAMESTRLWRTGRRLWKVRKALRLGRG